MVETNITNQEQKNRLLSEMTLFFARCFEPEVFKHYEVKEENECLKSENGLVNRKKLEVTD